MSVETTTEEENEQALFRKETDPSKLGKALSDTTTRRVIIGVLLMLMVLPLLTYSEIDYSSEYGLREVFWFGRSSCVQAEGDFYCDPQPWLTSEGWYQLLRNYIKSSAPDESSTLSKEIIWLYVPDFNNNGRLSTISYVPQAGSNSSDGAFWTQTDACAGFHVSSSCPYRYEEMVLTTFTPIECSNG